MSVNKSIILGNLGGDPELKYTPSGKAVCNFSVATTDKWKDSNGQQQERTEWHRIVVWGKLAELCNQYLSKGRQAFIEGSSRTRNYDDKNGVKRYVTEVIANSVQFIGGQQSSDSQVANVNNAQDASGQEYTVSADAKFAADDIPF